MKQIFYTLFLLTSVGTIGLVATNPKLVQQGAALIGLNQSEDDSARAPHDEEDHLAKFLRQYPDNPYSASRPTPEPSETGNTVPGSLDTSLPPGLAPPIVPPVKTPEPEPTPKEPAPKKPVPKKSVPKKPAPKEPVVEESDRKSVV